MKTPSKKEAVNGSEQGHEEIDVEKAKNVFKIIKEDIETGESIAMISGYDEFTERAYPNYQGGTENQRDIRDMLIKIMEKNDFSVYEYEWWHFNYNNCKSGIMNFSFSELESLNSI